MASLYEMIFGNMPPQQPAHPPSRGALLGARYQGLPDTTAGIEDRRSEGPDYTIGMRKHRATATDAASEYWPSGIPGSADPWGGGQFSGGYDPLVASPLIATRGLRGNTPGDYVPSFPPNLRPPRQPSFPRGSNLPSSSSDSDLPYIGSHLPWTPGDPGWTPPPSVPTLPARPTSSRFSPLIPDDALRFWRGDAP